MQEYEVGVNSAQAKGLALQVAADDVSVIWLVKLIDTAFDNAIQQEGALDRLNNALSQRGYKLFAIGMQAEKPAKACKPAHAEETLGQVIRRLRKAKGWSQTVLSDQCGWGSQIRISNYEKDTREPALDDLRKLAEALGVSIGDLVASPGAKQPKAAARGVVSDIDEDRQEWRNTKKHYDPVEENGPKVLALICRYSLTVETLRDKFEVTPEEYERIRSQHWADFGKRWMHELLKDLTTMYAKEKQREALQLDDKRPKPVRLMKPAQMTRPQLVAELNSLFNNHSWLTRAELVNNFEMGEDDYEAIKSLNHMKVTVHELRMYLTDVRGAIAKRAIEIPSKAVADEPK